MADISDDFKLEHFIQRPRVKRPPKEKPPHVPLDVTPFLAAAARRLAALPEFACDVDDFCTLPCGHGEKCDTLFG